MRSSITRIGIAFLTVLLFTVFSDSGRCTAVKKTEAIAAADLWFAMEINSEHTKMTPELKAERLAKIGDREVLYLLSRDELVSEVSVKEGVLAYVVKYKPEGFVVVTGEDRMEPVLVYNAAGTFSFENPEQNYMCNYLSTALVGRWERLEQRIAAGEKPPVHEDWIDLRNRMKSSPALKHAIFGAQAQERSNYVLWDTPLWNQPWPYNETAEAQNGGNNVPTGCTATAMAIKLRYHEWPPSGVGTYSYSDKEGSIQYSHFVDFGASTYDYSAMPFGNVTISNQDVADLIYHCGVSVSMDYELAASGAWPTTSSMNIHFRYKGTEEHDIFHVTHARASIIGGLPVVMSSSPHTVVACGYRSSPAPYFYINAGYNGSSNGWYDLTGIPGGGINPVQRSYPYSSPNNYIYVNTVSPYPGYGTLQHPYTTLELGESAIPTGGELWIAGGTYTGSGNVPLKIKKAMTIKAYDGPVTIE